MLLDHLHANNIAYYYCCCSIQLLGFCMKSWYRAKQYRMNADE